MPRTHETLKELTMSPTITNTTGESEMPGLVQKIGNQMLSTVSQGQQFAVDVVTELMMAPCQLALKLADVFVTKLAPLSAEIERPASVATKI